MFTQGFLLFFLGQVPGLSSPPNCGCRCISGGSRFRSRAPPPPPRLMARAWDDLRRCDRLTRGFSADGGTELDGTSAIAGRGLVRAGLPLARGPRGDASRIGDRTRCGIRDRFGIFARPSRRHCSRNRRRSELAKLANYHCRRASVRGQSSHTSRGVGDVRDRGPRALVGDCNDDHVDRPGE